MPRSDKHSLSAKVFLVEQGLAERRGQRVVLMRDLLATLRARDIEQAARDRSKSRAVSFIGLSRTDKLFPGCIPVRLHS